MQIWATVLIKLTVTLLANCLTVNRISRGASVSKCFVVSLSAENISQWIENTSKLKLFFEIHNEVFKMSMRQSSKRICDAFWKLRKDNNIITSIVSAVLDVLSGKVPFYAHRIGLLTKMWLANRNHSTNNFYRPQRSCGQGYVFTRVCHSVNRGVCLSACWDTTPWKQTPFQEGGTPPGYDQWMSGRYASYWNAFLFYFQMYVWRHLNHGKTKQTLLPLSIKSGTNHIKP